MIDNVTLYKIAAANNANPYADITPLVVQVGYPEVRYNGIVLQQKEVILYALPASLYNDKEKIVGYTGGSASVSVRVAKGLSVRTGSSKGKPIRSNVRDYISGELIITNKRLVFVAPKKGFEIKIEKITAAKIIDKQSFMIQTGNTSKNIQVDEALTAYAIVIIQHAITSYVEGKDLYTDYHLVQGSMTLEQKQLCIDVKRKISTIKIKSKKKTGDKPLVVLAAVIFVIFAVVLGISQGESEQNEKVIDEDNLTEESSVLISNYSEEEIVNFTNHPRIFDEIDYVKGFVGYIKDDRINVVYTEAGKTLTVDDTEPYEDAIVTYHRDSTHHDYVGRFTVNIENSDLAKNLTLDNAVEICVSYLPEKFATLYKCDRAYIKETDKATIYTYAMRLNEEGSNFHNEENKQYSYYLSTYIIDYKEENKWVIKSDYSAFGDEDVGWIDKYTTPWDIKLVNE